MQVCMYSGMCISVVLKSERAWAFPSICLPHVFSDSCGMMKLPHDHVLESHLPSGIPADEPKMLFTCVNSVLAPCACNFMKARCVMACLWGFKDTLGFGPYFYLL